MFTLTTPNGTVLEASTEKELRALLKKAAAAERKAAQEQQANYERARTMAEAMGYRVLVRKGDYPRGWHWSEPMAKYAPWKVDVDATTGTKSVVAWQGEHGTATTDLYGMQFWGGVENGSGFPMVAFFMDVSVPENRTIRAYSIGVYADQACIVELPGVTIESFKQPEEEAA